MTFRSLEVGWMSGSFWIVVAVLSGFALFFLRPDDDHRPRLHKRASFLGRIVSFLGLSLALHATPAKAERRTPIPPVGGAPQGQPWFGSGFPPPLPLARTTPRPESEDGAGIAARLESDEAADAKVHPAVHRDGTGERRVVPLFPRITHSDERAAAMARHPSGRDLAWRSHLAQRRHVHSRLHVVRTGESLWTIAAAELRSDDPARVARYWHRVYLRNRAVIGTDPDLIKAGQVLTLPSEIEA